MNIDRAAGALLVGLPIVFNLFFFLLGRSFDYSKGGHFEMRFDPAWFTSGITASRAALQDTGSSDVPNDNYVIEEGRRLLTYVVPSSARVTVLTNNGLGIAATPITVSELARIVNGGKHRKLFEPLDSGAWIRVHVDTVRSLDQQYRP